MAIKLDKEYNRLSRLKYKIWRLDELLLKIVWRRDRRCCRCTTPVHSKDARAARICSPNNFNNRFNPDLVALCCPRCQEYCVTETEFALRRLYQQNPDFPLLIRMKMLSLEDVKDHQLIQVRALLNHRLEEETNYVKNLVESIKNDTVDKTREAQKTS